jgi:hypothetical protein
MAPGVEFWIGLGIIPGLVVVYIAFGWLLTASRAVWKAFDYRMLGRVVLAKRVNPFSSEPKPYEWAANRLRDALLESPRLYTARGFGWMVFLVRNVKDDDTE